MTGANSRLPTLVYQNLSSANPRDGTTEGPGSVNLSRTIENTISFASLAVSSEEPIRIAPRQTDIVQDVIEIDNIDPNEEEGEDLTLFWEALHRCQDVYTQIKQETVIHSQYSCAPLLDQLTVEDLLEWMYPDVSDQLRDYIHYQEE